MRAVLGQLAAVAALLAAGSSRAAVVEKIDPVWPQRGYDATHHARSPFQGPHLSGEVQAQWTSPYGKGFSDYPGEARGLARDRDRPSC